MKKSNNELLTYKKYLESLDKKSINKIIDLYQLDCKKNCKKEKCINVIMENIHNIAKYTLTLFQQDELINLKLLIKKKGHLTVRINYLLQAFLDNLTKRYLIIKKSDNEYYIPDELLVAYKIKLKSKKIEKLIKKNTEEYNLILGFIDSYGVVEFDYFYYNYSKIYKLNKEDTLKRLNDLATFFEEFKIYKEKDKHYLASNTIKTLKECKEYAKRLGNYAVYTNEELCNIHTLKFIEKNKAYKKLVKFITHNYNISKGSMKIVNKFIITPFFTENQKNPEGAEKILSALIDRFFEYNNDKHKNKFIELIKDNAKDFPRWTHKGSIERI